MVLKKINRGLKRKDLDLLRDEGTLYQSPLFGLSVIETGSDELRLATIVSKKISKRAVDRNRIRRLLLKAAKLNLGLLEGKKIKAVFLGKKIMLGKKFNEVDVEVKKIFEMIKRK